MKLTHNKLKQLIKEVLEEASKKAPFGPFTGREPYVASQRSAKLSGDHTRKLRGMDDDQARAIDDAFGIDNPETTEMLPPSVMKHVIEYDEIIANQWGQTFTKSSDRPQLTKGTPVGDAYKIGEWTGPQHKGGVFVNHKGLFVLNDDGSKSFFTPQDENREIMPITKEFNEQIFHTMFEGKRR